jgi:hypothetical protein
MVIVVVQICTIRSNNEKTYFYDSSWKRNLWGQINGNDEFHWNFKGALQENAMLPDQS